MESMLSLFRAMAAYEQGEAARIQHFTKVYTYCDLLSKQEQLAEPARQTLLAAALVHDCGIRPSLVKYGSSAGSYQQQEGPAVAKTLLEQAVFTAETVDRVCYLVAHHHTYHDIDGLDYQILVEADFLVNMLEEQMTQAQIASVRERIFRTASGRWLLDQMFPAKA